MAGVIIMAIFVFVVFFPHYSARQVKKAVTPKRRRRR